MPKFKKFKTKKFIAFFKKLPLVLGKNAFFTFLGLFILALLFASLVFYTNYISIKNAESNVVREEFKFDSELYQKILQIWEDKEQKLKETDSRGYPNPFAL